MGSNHGHNPCIDLCKDHDHNRVSKGSDNGLLLLFPRGTG